MAAPELQDLSGKVAVVTGGTSALGIATVRRLLEQNATVYVAARSESKASSVMTDLAEEGLGTGKRSGRGRVFWHKLVLDDPKDAKKSAEEFLKRESRLDILSE